MTIHIVIGANEVSQRIVCYDGLESALEVAHILHRESGRRVRVVGTGDDGVEVSLLRLPVVE